MKTNIYDGLTHDSGKESNALAAENKPINPVISRIADIICEKIETREETSTGCDGAGYFIRWTINLDIPTEEYKKMTEGISFDELAEEVNKRLASIGYEDLSYDGDEMPAKWAGARGVPELASPSPIAYLYDKKKHYFDINTDEWR